MLRDKMLAVMAEVNAQVAEREELVEAIAVALLTRKNLFILGMPGQAKSYAINQFRARITDARQFERLLSKQTDEEQLFGRIDLASLIPGGVPQVVLDRNPLYQEMRGRLQTQLAAGKAPGDMPEKIEQHRKALAAIYGGEPYVNTAGKLPEADICFLDEIFKCNDGVLNSLLTALNERKYTNEGRTYPIPTISFFAASNEIPNFGDPQEKILEALYDRLELKVVTEEIAQRENRMAVLKSKQTGGHGAISARFTLSDLTAMQSEVTAIPVSDAINELADDILCSLRKDGIRVSDRKYLNYYPLAQAKAWLEGHQQVEPQDLLILRHYLWEKPSDRAKVASTLERMCINPLQDKANNIIAMSIEIKTDFDLAAADPDKSTAGSKALIKLRGELIRLYQMQQEMEAAAQTDNEKELAAKVLEGLETVSRKAHETVGFTYAPLSQLVALQ